MHTATMQNYRKNTELSTKTDSQNQTKIIYTLRIRLFFK